MQRLCSRCHQLQPCEDKTIQINYGFNDKEHVLIDGIERVCKVCGWHVDDTEVSVLNHDIAIKALNSGGSKTTQTNSVPLIDVDNTEDIESDDNNNP